MVTYRIASIDDFEGCRPYDFSHVPDEWLRQSFENGWVYVAEDDDQIIGLARLEFIWLTIPYIGLITLKEEHRHKGIGSALIEYIAQDLSEQDHRALLTSTEDEGTPEFYKKCGFSQCGVISEINETGNDEIYLIRYLSSVISHL